MRRREVFALPASAAMLPPLAARMADRSSKVFRLGALIPTPPGPGYPALIQQLHVLGYEEGRNLQIDFVQLDITNAGRSLVMAAELVGRGVDAIYAAGSEDVLKAAMTATRAVPIVLLANDYDTLARGYITSLARPGGNVTGVFLQQVELTASGWIS